MATTEYGVNHPLAVKVWQKKLLREALKETYCSRFMGTTKDSLCYVKDELNKSAGDRIRIGLRMQLAGDGVTGDGTLEGNEESLTTYYDDLFINQLRHAVRSDGEMTEQRVPFSVREEAMDGLRDWWADRIDTAFFNQLGGNAAQTNVAYTGMQAATEATKIFLPGTTSTTASLTSSAATQGMALELIDRCVNQAKINSPLIRPLRVNGQSKYVAFLHPNQVRQLKTTVTTSAITWFDVMRARVEGGDIEENPIYTGALGEYNGTILHESTRVPSAAADTNIKKMIFCGAQACSFGTGRRDQGSQMKWVEELFDYENQLGVSAAMIWGLKKNVFNASDFSTIVCLTQSPNPT